MKKRSLASIFIISSINATHCYAAENTIDTNLTQVSVTPAQYSPIFQTKTYSTALIASERVQVIALTTGYLEKKFVRNGQTVTEGDVIVKLEDIDYTINHQEAMANLALASAQLKEAKSAYERGIKVRKHGDIAESTFDKMEAAYESAKAQQSLAKAYEKRALVELERTQIRSTTNGKITSLYVDEGQALNRGEPISYIVNDAHIDAVIELPSNDPFIQNIHNLTAKLIVNNQAYSTDGELYAIDGAIDPKKGSLKISYRFDNNGELLDGQYAKVVLSNTTPKGNIAIPQASVLTDREGKFVYLVVDNKVVIKRVNSLGTNELHELIEGVNQGDSVITSPTIKLYPGLDVSIKG
ncbi:efflux RND transporter periplasmic adaptor subunit [Shewanella schlegeliana]|uniref:Efflux RND transporter periplasmic adaptor subunit n=1 Tax=Shewanella schlegeliana TaxID=190308 RepID=A0ABS1T0J8_9GAMM|nr:efflux RND transporter periplasmic adaptor subunit [Shewanella schlegeliana]MBL4914313.1 efflux RND transporter periplasmic adaptor subunit [Shewanella schlegeliana]MCL1109464.1 efflux RND transporter periplasmic adaptor subunit [Shewanella schlegeliana]GIU37347.1 acriflavin resistance protein [Shewanella schlegeliana]